MRCRLLSRVAFALIGIATVGCGASRAESPGGHASDEPVASDTSDQSNTEARAAASDSTTDGDVAVERAPEESSDSEVPETPSDPCAAVVPEPSWEGQPLFMMGDPCERVRPECAWSVSARRCVTFASVPACPPTLADAQAASVLCNHSQQTPLSCAFGATRCSCIAPSYCGGAPPPPDIEHPPATFVCVPPFDARGCPTGPVREGGRCTLDPSVDCVGCQTAVQCVRGRWQSRELPPRP